MRQRQTSASSDRPDRGIGRSAPWIADGDRGSAVKNATLSVVAVIAVAGVVSSGWMGREIALGTQSAP